MLYATTRDKHDVVTAHKAAHTDCYSDGGLFVPFRMPLLPKALNIISKRVAYRACLILVIRNLLDYTAHKSNERFDIRLNHRHVAHKTKHHALASAAFVALEGNYLLVKSANLAPVCDLTRIDLSYLIRRE